MTLTRDRELWGCANLLIERHGEDAAIQAAMRSDELDEAGDKDGADVWRMILDRILMLTTVPDGHPH